MQKFKEFPPLTKGEQALLKKQTQIIYQVRKCAINPGINTPFRQKIHRYFHKNTSVLLWRHLFLLGSSLNVRRNQTITKYSSESELVRGRLKICSKSLVFVPQESADPSQPDTKPLLKFPLADCTKIEGKFALQCYYLNLKTSLNS